MLPPLTSLPLTSTSLRTALHLHCIAYNSTSGVSIVTILLVSQTTKQQPNKRTHHLILFFFFFFFKRISFFFLLLSLYLLSAYVPLAEASIEATPTHHHSLSANGQLSQAEL